ncbi:hypothetical protein BKG74_03395 [Mycobacteroides chelonae]|nr:hypothetical protein BKG74_03395 [Mycobacteroides chelonae]
MDLNPTAAVTLLALWGVERVDRLGYLNGSGRAHGLPFSIISQAYASRTSALVMGRAQRGLSIAAMEFMPNSHS